LIVIEGETSAFPERRGQVLVIAKPQRCCEAVYASFWTSSAPQVVAHEAKEETEEGHIESRAPIGGYFKGEASVFPERRGKVLTIEMP